jgi:hypothetical protein
MPPAAALQTLLDQLTPLPAEEQAYLAALLGSYLEAEQQWAAEFERTREQLARRAEEAAAAGKNIIPPQLNPTALKDPKYPEAINLFADALLVLFRQDPADSETFLRRVHPVLPVYAFPMGPSYRFLGHYRDGRMTWFWG